jgi:hypothetical protein
MIIDNQAGVTPGQMKRLISDVSRMAGSAPIYVNIRQVMPLDLTVAFSSADELSAYKLAYAYREHAKSRVKIETARGPAMPGAFLVVIHPK